MSRGIIMVDLFNRQPRPQDGLMTGAVNLNSLGCPAEQLEFVAGATINEHGFAEVEAEYDPHDEVELPEGVRYESTVLRL